MQPETLFDEQAFIAKYWHPNTEVVTVLNPTKNDYIFSATVDAAVDVRTGKPRPEMRQYRVPAGGSERFPGSIANMYLDQMSRNLAQVDGRLDRMVDWTEKAKYYESLTSNTEDLIASYSPNPAFEHDNQHIPSAESTEKEVPFAAAQEPVPAVQPTETKRMGRPPKNPTEV